MSASIQPIHTALSTQYTAQARSLALHLSLAGVSITAHEVLFWPPEGIEATQAYIISLLGGQPSQAITQLAVELVATYDAMMAQIISTITSEEEAGYEEAI